MAIKASFSQGAHLLSELGDSADNTITTSRDAAGQILVNGGAVPIQGGPATVANTASATSRQAASRGSSSKSWRSTPGRRGRGTDLGDVPRDRERVLRRHRRAHTPGADDTAGGRSGSARERDRADSGE